MQDYPFNQYYAQNDPNIFTLPPGEGLQWMNQNVDIEFNNRSRLCNVRFVDVQRSPTLPGRPPEYIWVVEDFSGGGAPVRRRISPDDVLQINFAGTICRGPGGWPPGGGWPGGPGGGPGGPGGGPGRPGGGPGRPGGGPGRCQWRWIPVIGWVCV